MTVCAGMPLQQRLPQTSDHGPDADFSTTHQTLRCSAPFRRHVAGTARIKPAVPPSLSLRAAPLSNPTQAAQGAIWIMLMLTMTSARPGLAVSSHDPSITSTSCGDIRFGGCASAAYAAMLPSLSASDSVGHQRKCGSAAAQCAPCWPVPEDISSRSRALAGTILSNCSRITAMLRSADGDVCFIRMTLGSNTKAGQLTARLEISVWKPS